MSSSTPTLWAPPLHPRGQLHPQGRLGWDLPSEGKCLKPASYTKEDWNLFPLLMHSPGCGLLRGLDRLGLPCPCCLVTLRGIRWLFGTQFPQW